jgi:DNA-binding MarR family transcriptional regulator
MTTADPAHDFGILLGLAYQAFVDELHAELRRHGFKDKDLAPTHGYVLRAVAEEPINQRQLSKILRITDQGTGKIVVEMERLRLLARVDDPEDGRARRLTLGSRGKELLRVARAFHARFERDLAKSLGTSAVTSMRHGLEHVVAREPPDGGPRRLRPM